MIKRYNFVYSLTVTIPSEFEEPLKAEGLHDAFDQHSFTQRKAYVTSML